MKSEKGLTFITTIILVVIIAILTFGIVYFVRIQYAKESLENLKTDMLLVQAKVKKIEGEYTLEKKDEVLKGTKIADMQEDEIIKQFLEKELIDIKEKNSKYYVLNQDDLNEMDLTKVTLEDNNYYIVNYSNNEVFYTKGFTYSDGNTYYKLTQIEELNIE